jgi:hypothetical protein
MRRGAAVSAIGHTGHSDDSHSPDEWARGVVRAKPRRGTWRPATGIPDRAAHREMVPQLLERTRKERADAIERAKAALRAA